MLMLLVSKQDLIIFSITVSYDNRKVMNVMVKFLEGLLLISE